MKIRKWTFLLTACSLFLLLVSCDLDSIAIPAELAMEQETDSVGEDIQGIAPVCPDGSFYGVISETFPMNTIVSTTPSFEWHYYMPGGLLGRFVEDWDSVCKPERYAVYLSSGPDYTDSIVFQVTDPEISIENNYLLNTLIGNHQSIKWDLNGSLLPATTYRWTVVGYNGYQVIDDLGLLHLHDDAWWPTVAEGINVGGVFRTGPECTLDNPGGMRILSLDDNVEINTLGPRFSWQIFECNPLGFRLKISTSREFSDPVYYVDGDYFPPYEYPQYYTLFKSTALDSIQLEDILQDCTRYYWSIRAITEVQGPYGVSYIELYGTQPRTFFVNLGACANKSGVQIPTTAPGIGQTVTQAPPPGVTPTFSCMGLSDVNCKIHEDECVWVISKSGGFCKAR